MKTRLPIFLLVTSLLVTGFVVSVQAQEVADQTAANQQDQFALMAIPPRTENLKANPGEVIQTTIQVRNVTTTTQGITSHVEDYVISDDGKTPVPVTTQEAAPLRWSLASWITLTPNSLTLQPNQLGKITVVIRVPKDALPGGHYALVLHTTTLTGQKTPAGGKTTSMTTVNPRVGTLVYLTVAGDIKEQAFVRLFTAPKWVEFGPVDMTFKVENLSDIHLAPRSSVTVKNLFGRTIDTIAVEPENIFPYSMRAFTARFDRLWGLGPYFASLTVPYGTHGNVASASLVFWMIPYRVILSILVILAVLLVIAISVRRYVEHKNDLRTKRIEILEERIKELEKEAGRKP